MGGIGNTFGISRDSTDLAFCQHLDSIYLKLKNEFVSPWFNITYDLAVDVGISKDSTDFGFLPALRLYISQVEKWVCVSLI